MTLIATCVSPCELGQDSWNAPASYMRPARPRKHPSAFARRDALAIGIGGRTPHNGSLFTEEMSAAPPPGIISVIKHRFLDRV